MYPDDKVNDHQRQQHQEYATEYAGRKPSSTGSFDGRSDLREGSGGGGGGGGGDGGGMVMMPSYDHWQQRRPQQQGQYATEYAGRKPSSTGSFDGRSDLREGSGGGGGGGVGGGGGGGGMVMMPSYDHWQQRRPQQQEYATEYAGRKPSSTGSFDGRTDGRSDLREGSGGEGGGGSDGGGMVMMPSYDHWQQRRPQQQEYATEYAGRKPSSTGSFDGRSDLREGSGGGVDGGGGGMVMMPSYDHWQQRRPQQQGQYATEYAGRKPSSTGSFDGRSDLREGSGGGGGVGVGGGGDGGGMVMMPSYDHWQQRRPQQQGQYATEYAGRKPSSTGSFDGRTDGRSDLREGSGGEGGGGGGGGVTKKINDVISFVGSAESMLELVKKRVEMYQVEPLKKLLTQCLEEQGLLQSLRNQLNSAHPSSSVCELTLLSFDLLIAELSEIIQKKEGKPPAVVAASAATSVAAASSPASSTSSAIASLSLSSRERESLPVASTALSTIGSNIGSRSPSRRGGSSRNRRVLASAASSALSSIAEEHASDRGGNVLIIPPSVEISAHGSDDVSRLVASELDDTSNSKKNDEVLCPLGCGEYRQVSSLPRHIQGFDSNSCRSETGFKRHLQTFMTLSDGKPVSELDKEMSTLRGYLENAFEKILKKENPEEIDTARLKVVTKWTDDTDDTNRFDFIGFADSYILSPKKERYLELILAKSKYREAAETFLAERRTAGAGIADVNVGPDGPGQNGGTSVPPVADPSAAASSAAAPAPPMAFLPSAGAPSGDERTLDSTHLLEYDDMSHEHRCARSRLVASSTDDVETWNSDFDYGTNSADDLESYNTDT